MSQPKVRFGVFETNSSSTHSICIAFGDISPPKMEGGVLTIEPGEFGWEVEDHYDFATKASYLYTWCYNKSHTYDDEPEKELEGERKEKLDLLTETLKEYVGCDEVLYLKEDSYYPRGYLDHQSDESDRCPALEAFESKETLVQFLFNERSFVHTDNDNR